MPDFFYSKNHYILIIIDNKNFCRQRSCTNVSLRRNPRGLRLRECRILLCRYLLLWLLNKYFWRDSHSIPPYSTILLHYCLQGVAFQRCLLCMTPTTQLLLLLFYFCSKRDLAFHVQAKKHAVAAETIQLSLFCQNNKDWMIDWLCSFNFAS